MMKKKGFFFFFKKKSTLNTIYVPEIEIFCVTKCDIVWMRSSTKAETVSDECVVFLWNSIQLIYNYLRNYYFLEANYLRVWVTS